MRSTPSTSALPRLLIIDDNRAIHDDFRKIFGARTDTEALTAAEASLFGAAPKIARTSKFQIDSAYQGQEGLALVEQSLATGNPYALAFVDVRMPPGWDGIETVARIWAVQPELQVVICTAYSDYSWADMVQRLGETDTLMLLKKPFDNAEVLQLASALTKRCESLHQIRRYVAELETTLAQRTAELRRSEERFRRNADTAAEIIGFVTDDTSSAAQKNGTPLEAKSRFENQLTD
jgi:YesN/AraC family two-component response regulator